MNQPSDSGPRTSVEAADVSPTPPANWREALMALMASRYALILLESKEAAKEGGRRAGLVAAACVCAVFAWALLIVGGISILAVETGWQWNFIAVGAAVAHLLAGIGLAKAAKPSPGEPFSHTRAEFQKDRQWIENYHGTKKSDG